MKRTETAFVAFCIGLGTLAAFWPVSKKAILTAKPQIQAGKSWTDRVQPHLEWADKEIDKGLAQEVSRLGTFFETAKSGTPAFVDKALGWESKWYYGLDKAPFTSGAQHLGFLTKTFDKQVFSGHDLERLIRQVTGSFLNSIEAVENQMLVRLHRDVKDLSKSPAIAFDQGRLQAAFHQALGQTNALASKRMNGEIAKEVTSLVSGEVLTAITIRLGVSSGVIGAGASSSLATLGIGLAVGIAADQVISWGWNQLADPKGKLVQLINTKLDDLQRLLIEGDKSAPGFRKWLQDHAGRRSQLRLEAIRSLGSEGGSK